MSEIHQALFAFADPRHAWHSRLRHLLLWQRHPDEPGNVLFSYRPAISHPVGIEILRQALEDHREVGKVTIQEDHVSVVADGSDALWWGGQTLPKELADPAVRRDEAPLHVCDLAAWRLAGLVVHSPPYHPLYRDAERRLNQVRKAVGQFPCLYRRITDSWGALRETGVFANVYILAITPLARAATALDVRQGRALFHWNGRGRVIPLPPDPVGLLREPGKKPLRVRILQAELAPDGRVLLGVVGRRTLATVPAQRVTRIHSAQLDEEDDLTESETRPAAGS
jgi:hypothetical protein